MGIREFFGLCAHQWEIVRRGVITETYFGDFIGKTHWSVHQCKKCGKLKREQVKT